MYVVWPYQYNILRLSFVWGGQGEIVKILIVIIVKKKKNILCRYNNNNV